MKILKISTPIITVAITFVIILVTQIIFFSLRDNDQISFLNNQIENYKHKELALEDNIRLLNEKTNEIRSMLSLPEITLFQSILDNESKIEEELNENLPFYNAIDYIQNYSLKSEMENELHSLLTSSKVNEYFIVNDIKIQKSGSSTYKIYRFSSFYLTIKAENPENPSIYFTSINGNSKKFLLKDIINNNTEMLNYFNSEFSVLKKHYIKYRRLKDNFASLYKDTSFLNFLKKEKLELSELQEITSKIFYILSNKDKSFSLKIYLDSINLSYELGTKKYEDYSDFYNSLKQFLLDSDIRTGEIKVVDVAKEKVESILSADSFLSYLKQNNLLINLTPREDNDYFYYDISKESKEFIGSFAVQKIIGDIYLMDTDDIMISSLKYLETSTNISSESEGNIDIPDNLPQIIDNYSNSKSTTFVVIGSHENNADTIILIHADGINEKITLIAIPRDLYYQENKINDYYRTFGGEKFIEVLSEITGLRIDGYIAVDMYAFIDLINILGGIDITLESDLIDPTYMVRDNGEWSTLYYTKGTHHLNGIESLRIARSRHTSSDFGRTTRQQLVIQGIKDKMSLLDITDLGTILELFRTLEKYLDTNFSSMEMLSLFTKYKDSNLNRKQGLSTFNVLYNTYTNIYKLEDKSKQYEEDFYRGYWILLPRKNDWNVIKWYIRSLIEGTEI